MNPRGAFLLNESARPRHTKAVCISFGLNLQTDSLLKWWMRLMQLQWLIYCIVIINIIMSASVAKF